MLLGLATVRLSARRARLPPRLFARHTRFPGGYRRPISSATSTAPANARNSGYSEKNGNSEMLWGIASAMLFVPAFVYLTSPPKSYARKSTVSDSQSNLNSHNYQTHPQNVQSVVIQEKDCDHFEYVLVGGGTASYSAMLGIQEVNPDAEILIITAEPYSPYQRPPLTKELWFSEDPEIVKNLKFKNWEGKLTSLFYQSDKEYSIVKDDFAPTGSGVKLCIGRKATKLNVDDRSLTLDDGSVIKYGKILLATGGFPRTLPLQRALPSNIKDRVTTYRTLDDFKHLDAITRSGGNVAVIGGGFLGSELAVALATRGKVTGTKVTQVFPEDGNMALVFPKYLTKWTTDRVKETGVDIIPNRLVKNARYSKDSDKIHLVLNDNSEIICDHVVVAVGIEPNVELASSAGLEIDSQRGGIVVNAELEARHNVFAAGDCVSFHDVYLGRRRVEHYDNAVLTGRWAGANMAKPIENRSAFRHQSMFWSDLGPSIGYEAVGILDGSLVTVAIWTAPERIPTKSSLTAINESRPENSEQTAAAMEKNQAQQEKEKYKKGVVFYSRDDQIVGILMFNVHGLADEARKILAEKHKPEEANELAKRFNLFK